MKWIKNESTNICWCLDWMLGCWDAGMLESMNNESITNWADQVNEADSLCGLFVVGAARSHSYQIELARRRRIEQIGSGWGRGRLGWLCNGISSSAMKEKSLSDGRFRCSIKGRGADSSAAAGVTVGRAMRRAATVRSPMVARRLRLELAPVCVVPALTPGAGAGVISASSPVPVVASGALGDSPSLEEIMVP
eukprot:CAMPEP_0205903396 /NCGR_PEP_ID=MMETSP1325-20131115/80_1 /ASSEMBLY_ACC=CAM_ASM_000708 /TAXON_ID=236786 /ORGANISM="Florenciella sp., Strain RCC1007" /LENGTH=192 /DNA_ID=CAMNT_0053269049 /DNA_START=466 /DNA_END=1041 /DNA_ORIENTATION=+